MAQEWYVEHHDRVAGPYTADEMRQRARDGRLRPESRVSRDLQQWVRASQVRGLEFGFTVAASNASGEPTHGHTSRGAHPPPGEFVAERPPAVSLWLMIDGMPRGPFDAAQIRAKLAAHEVCGETLACPMGSNSWLPLVDFSGIGPPPAPKSTAAAPIDTGRSPSGGTAERVDLAPGLDDPSYKTKPPPGAADIAAAVQHFVTYWVAKAWAAKPYSYYGIAAACVLAVVIVWPRGHGTEQEAIRRVICQNNVLVEEVVQKAGLMDKYWDGSGLVWELVERLDAIDLTGCPPDFQSAYKKHVAAWASLARVKGNNEGVNGFIKGFMTVGLSVIPAMSQIEGAGGEVMATGSEVQQVAIRHGVAP